MARRGTICERGWISGDVLLSITHALCDTVWGTWEFTYERSSKGPFRGHIEGNQLTYGSMTLEIQDKQMTGSFPSWKVSLRKTK